VGVASLAVVESSRRDGGVRGGEEKAHIFDPLPIHAGRIDSSLMCPHFDPHFRMHKASQQIEFRYH
jgi:hypothetical protein